MEKKRKVKNSTLIISIGILLIIFLVCSFFWIFKLGIQSNYSKSISKIIPFPVVFINGESVVFYDDFFDNVDSLKNFYRNQDFSSVGIRVDLTTEEGKRRFRVKEKEVLNKMIEDDLVRDLAEERGIEISSKVAKESVERMLQETGFRDNIESNLDKLYGWSMEDFEEKVVLPSVYADKLKESVEKDILNDVNLKIKESIDSDCKNIKSEEDFNRIALEYANKGDSERNGDLGWFKQEQLSEDLSEKIFSMKTGDISDIIESEMGYHVIMLKEKKNEAGEELVSISQVFSPKDTFEEWLIGKLKDANVKVLSDDYFWDRENVTIEFKDEELRSYGSFLGL